MYTITLTADHMGRTKYGFELGAATISGTAIGGFIHTTGFTKTVNTNNATHTSSGTAAAGGSRTWTLNWTAPSAGSGTITFYYALNATNSNNSSSGDQIIKSTLSVQEKVDPCVINDGAVNAQSSTICEGAGTNILLATSEVGISYQLKNASTDVNIGSMQSGNGSGLVFPTGTLGSSTTFKILATKNATCNLTLSNQPTVAVSVANTPTITVTGHLPICPGDSVILSSSTANTYLWNTGASSQSIVVKTAGNYSVTTTNSFNCSKTSSLSAVTTSSNPDPVISPTGSINICQGDSLIISTGAFASYLWSTGATSSSITVKNSGQYSVEVTNNDGCRGFSGITEVMVNSLPDASITVSGNNPFCPGDSIQLAAMDGFNYLWSNGLTSQSIWVSGSGNYSVKVNSANCSSFSDTIVASTFNLEKPKLNHTDTAEVCPNDSLTLSPLLLYNSYLWNTGATDPGIRVATPGTYWVEVTDANGCRSNSDTIELVMANGVHPKIFVNGKTALCPGDSITLSVDQFDNYLWSDGSTAAFLRINQPGEYFVFVSRNSGCEGFSDTVQVTALQTPIVSTDPVGNQVSCDSLAISATPGYIDYRWSNGWTGSRITLFKSGDYFVSVTDSNGCVGSSDTLLLELGNTPLAIIQAGGGFAISNYPMGNRWFYNGVEIPGAFNDSLPFGQNGTYFTVVTDSAGICSDTSNSILYQGAGITETLETLVRLYPNPASGKLYVHSESPFIGISVLNYLGQKIENFNTKSMDYGVDISKFASGSYIIMVYYEGGKTVIRPFNILNQ